MDTEKTIMRLRTSAFYHFISLYLAIILFGFWLAFCFLPFGDYAALLVLSLLFALRVALAVFYSQCRITPTRLIATSGILSKTVDEIWIDDILGASLYQSFSNRLFNIGTISLETASGSDFILVGVPNPKGVLKKINALRRAS